MSAGTIDAVIPNCTESLSMLEHMPDQSVDVIIPVFNRSEELIRALDSLLLQTDADFGVIVCDDGSNEDISAVTNLYKDQLELKLIRIENSGGPARPRNVAVANSRATWISFLDSDDWWFTEKIAEVRKALDGSCDLVYHQLQTVRSRNAAEADPSVHREIIGDAIRTADPLRHMLKFGNPVPTSACVVRRKMLEKIGGFEESRALASVEDFDAWLRLCVQGARLKFIPKQLGAYWIGDNQISTFDERQMEKQENLFRRQLELLPDKYLKCAKSNFGYLMGSYAAKLGLPDARNHFAAVSLWNEPVRWLKARVKMMGVVSGKRS
ncbi:MAG: glycosyltransferase family 2 protein [Sphingomonadaceae bacterium]|nr:glycosyltransferase family 2 protein [Sphingomonadaceae bacterium]